MNSSRWRMNSTCALDRLPVCNLVPEYSSMGEGLKRGNLTITAISVDDLLNQKRSSMRVKQSRLLEFVAKGKSYLIFYR